LANKPALLFISFFPPFFAQLELGHDWRALFSAKHQVDFYLRHPYLLYLVVVK
jgi:hypothetical protein